MHDGGGSVSRDCSVSCADGRVPWKCARPALPTLTASKSKPSSCTPAYTDRLLPAGRPPPVGPSPPPPLPPVPPAVKPRSASASGEMASWRSSRKSTSRRAQEAGWSRRCSGTCSALRRQQPSEDRHTRACATCATCGCWDVTDAIAAVRQRQHKGEVPRCGTCAPVLGQIGRVGAQQLLDCGYHRYLREVLMVVVVARAARAQRAWGCGLRASGAEACMLAVTQAWASNCQAVGMQSTTEQRKGQLCQIRTG